MLQRTYPRVIPPSDAHFNPSPNWLTQTGHLVPKRASKMECHSPSSTDSEAQDFTLGVSGLTPPEKSCPGIFLVPLGNPEWVSPQPP